jgi:hypothetical protein
LPIAQDAAMEAGKADVNPIIRQSARDHKSADMKSCAAAIGPGFMSDQADGRVTVASG